jgi:hypothetical protein
MEDKDAALFERQLCAALADFGPSLSFDKSAFRVVARKDSKSVLVLWPHPVAEVFLDFVDGGQTVLSESVEYYDAEQVTEQVQDVAQAIRNFLLNETRVAVVGRLFRRSELQLRLGDGWISVFADPTATADVARRPP